MRRSRRLTMGWRSIFCAYPIVGLILSPNFSLRCRETYMFILYLNGSYAGKYSFTFCVFTLLFKQNSGWSTMTKLSNELFKRKLKRQLFDILLFYEGFQLRPTLLLLMSLTSLVVVRNFYRFSHLVEKSSSFKCNKILKSA